MGDWDAKVGSQETPRVTGKFGFGVLPREHTGHSKPSSNNTREDYTWKSPDGQQ